MNFIDGLKSYILPREIDFFLSLKEQCQLTENIVRKLFDIYITGSSDVDQLRLIIADAKKMRTKNLIELNGVLITPVDKEAISRVYVSLHWIVLSVKHLDVELNVYQIKNLREYENILHNLNDQMQKLTGCFELLRINKFNEVLANVEDIIHLDNVLIKEYAVQLAKLFIHDDTKHIMQHKEILSQMKEVSKRIHFCTNSIEDIVFKAT